jgi:hypothetical protein
MQSHRRFLAAVAAAAALLTLPPRAASATTTSPYFQVTLRPGDAIENVFERTFYRTTAKRVSGYATYVITAVHGNRYNFTSSWAYYGRASGANHQSSAEIAPDGLYYGQKRVLATDSSGAFFNMWLWGTPPASLTAGTTWTYRIPQAWELGPAGAQTARVLSVDPINARIVLERTGSGFGAPLDETLPKIDGVQPTWGKTTWKGITIVRRGLIESDEVAVHHEIILPKSAGKPQHTQAMIEQIELGQVPYDGSLP